MSEARLSDLNYGHLGRPIYESERHEWCFTRNPYTVRRLKPIGQPVIAFTGSSESTTAYTQKSRDRSRHIKDLTHSYPELAPAAFLLSGLAQTSETVVEVTARHEPTASELLAFGEAIDRTSEKWGIRTIPIVAVAAGAAGEIVKLVRLTPHQQGWQGNGKVRLSCMTAKGGEEGFWVANGSPVQQLVFAEAEGKSGHWLAVRYRGGISILRPLLLPDVDVSTSHNKSTVPLSPSRLDLNHILTLSEHTGIPFSDVSFNPWNSQQFGTIDQEGRWTIWNIEVVLRAMQKGDGTVIEHSRGNILNSDEQGLASSSSIADGWGRVLWIGDEETIVVASRRNIAIFNIANSSTKLHVPSLGRSKNQEWLLDMKRSPMDSSSLFVVTSSAISWLQVPGTGGNRKPKDVESGVRILLSWKHFRDQEDVSLSLTILDVSKSLGTNNEVESTLVDASAQGRTTPASLVLLYSRLTGLTTVFTFHPKTSLSKQALSAADPYLFQFPAIDYGLSKSDAEAHSFCPSSDISAIVLQAVDYDGAEGSMSSGQSGSRFQDDVRYYRLSILLHDLTLVEGLYAEAKAALAPVPPPNVETRNKVLKTSAKIVDEFIVPDKFEDQFYQSPEHSLEEPIPQPSLVLKNAGPPNPDENPWSITLEWLEMEIHATVCKPSPTIDEILGMLYDKVKARGYLEGPPLETLGRLANTPTSIADIDKATADLADFLGDVARITWDENKGSGEKKGKQVAVSGLLTLPVQTALGLGKKVQLSDIYDSLIKTWIAPLPGIIPGRARIALEKGLRYIVFQICLASYGVRVSEGANVDEEIIHGTRQDSRAPFALPVRRRVSGTNLKQGKEPAARSSSPLVLPRISQDNSSLHFSSPPALVVSEQIPSLRIRGSVSSSVPSEDAASLRLKAYASLAPQPTLPNKLSNLLGQWELSADPADYNWEAAEQAYGNKESETETRAKQRRRTEKHRKRQGQDTTMPASQPPSNRVGDSQPQSTQEAPSSSQQPLDLIIQSQVERGRFGGRPVKAKKQKRTRGF